MNIQRKDLSALFQLCIDKLEQLDINEVNIDLTNKDLYWIISAPEWTDLTKEQIPEVGSFTDDWNSISRILTKEHPVAFIDFDRVASILRLLSAILNPIDENVILKEK